MKKNCFFLFPVVSFVLFSFHFVSVWSFHEIITQPCFWSILPGSQLFNRCGIANSTTAPISKHKCTDCWHTCVIAFSLLLFLVCCFLIICHAYIKVFKSKGLCLRKPIVTDCFSQLIEKARGFPWASILPLIITW